MINQIGGSLKRPTLKVRGPVGADELGKFFE
jgi:hypothetical protein